MTKESGREYEEGDLVWFDMQRLHRSKKSGQKRWVGPCTITSRSPGGLYGLEYKGGDMPESFARMHADALKPFKGEVE